MATTDSAAGPTEEEIGWAKSIKEAVEKDDKLKSLTDFEYMAHAIVAKDKTDKALKRIERMQAFREMYDIVGDGNVEDGMQRARAVVEAHPELFQSIGMDSKGRSVTYWQFDKFTANKVKTPEDWKAVMGGFFYFFHALQPNIGSIREGVVWVGDCKGVGWANFNMELEKRAGAFYSHCYPFRIKEMVMLDTPRIFSVFYGLIKVFLSKKVRSVVSMQPKAKYLETQKDVLTKDILPPSAGGTFLVDNFLTKTEELLKERFENAASFKL